MSYLSLAAFAAVTFVVAFLVKQLVWHPLAAYPDVIRNTELEGPVVRYSPSRLLINSSTAARGISSHGANVIKSKAYQALVHSAPNTLTIRNREDHARRRRILSLAFSDAQLRAYEAILLRHIDTLCLNLSDNAKSQASSSGSEALDMSHQCDYFTFDIMSEVIFGMKYNALREPKYRFVMSALEASNVRISALVQASSLALGRIDKYLFADSIKSRNKFLGFLGSLLKSRAKASFSDNGNVFSYLETAKDPDGESTLSKSEIRAESATLVVAGSDTSSTTLAATLFYLSGNARAYARLCHEIRSTFDSVEDIRIGAKLSSCNYLRACIDEALRMSPPVGGEDGSTKESELARTAFYPFSSGPRSCVGKGFAYHEITLTLAHILYRFDFTRSTKDQKSFGGSTGNVNEFQMWDHVTSAKTPNDICWPSDKEWGRFNSSIAGNLIQTAPPAAPCYAGPNRDAAACEAVTQGWSTATFQASQPIGYDYPLNSSCPLAQFTANAPSANCTIGNSPVFAVNVTDEEHISKAVEFAKKNNIRVVIKSTGHDFLQRSTGYGSLSIWLQNYRKGFNFHDDFQVVNECPKSDWKGSALTITGAYSWSDIYPTAFEKNLIVVGGNNRTYPTKNIDAIDVVIGTASTSANVSAKFIDAMTDIYSSYPYLSEVGFAGYGAWAMNSPVPIGGNFSTFYTQTFTTLGNDAAEATRLFKPIAEKITPLKDAGFTVSITQKAYTDYGAYYANKSGTDATVGGVSALASRLLGKSALEGNRDQLRKAMETMAGKDGKAVFHTVVHHGLQTAQETRDKSSAVQPGWYDAVILDIFERPILSGELSVSSNIDLFDDIRQNVLPVYRDFSPNTGTYMNEADWGDTNFQEDFYSSNWKQLIEIKTKLWITYHNIKQDECQTLQALHKKHGPIMRITPTMLLVTDATKLPEIYHRNANKSQHYITGSFGKTESLFNMQDHTVHARYRKIAAAPYAFSNIKKMEPLLDHHIDRWVEKLDNNFASPGKRLDFAPWAVYLVYDIVSDVGFGQPFGFIEQEKDVEGLIQGFHDGLVPFGIMARCWPFTNWVKSTFLGKYLVATPEQDSGIGTLMRFRDRLIAKRFEDIEKGATNGRIDLLQTFIEARDEKGEPLDLEYIKAEILLVLLAGADTTGTAFQAFMMHVLTHPEVYERLMEEIDTQTRAGNLSDIPHEEKTKKMLKYNMGFGYGARVCLGRDLAMMELSKAPLQLFRRFKPEAINKTDPGRYVVKGGVSFYEGMWINIERRPKTLQI
ncbi:isoamyl alcohol oxidase [Colletotrichum sp. SAR11_57]|nr:isoamyl alcohol oxidase [Colletotrichum sp. SAR11_57]